MSKAQGKFDSQFITPLKGVSVG